MEWGKMEGRRTGMGAMGGPYPLCQLRIHHEVVHVFLCFGEL